jgi:hypothetical protein
MAAADAMPSQECKARTTADGSISSALVAQDGRRFSIAQSRHADFGGWGTGYLLGWVNGAGAVAPKPEIEGKRVSMQSLTFLR